MYHGRVCNTLWLSQAVKPVSALSLCTYLGCIRGDIKEKSSTTLPCSSIGKSGLENKVDALCSSQESLMGHLGPLKLLFADPCGSCIAASEAASQPVACLGSLCVCTGRCYMKKKKSQLPPRQQVDFFHPIRVGLTPSTGKACHASPIKQNNLSEQTD